MIQNLILRLKLLAVIRFSVVGVIVGTGIGYVNYLVIDAQPQTTIGWGVIAGFGIGVMLGSMEVFVFFGRMRRAPFRRLLATRAGVYAVTFVLWLSLANAARVAEARGLPFVDAGMFYLLEEGIFLRDFILITLSAVVFVWILQAAQLQRWLDVFNFILGKYHRPQEVESIFLFVDVTSSTTIAEKLGHLTYSSFLQDFFYDVNMAALATRGSIYQYVGDEVIVTWPKKLGTERANCVECFWRILDEVETNKDRYLEEYGIVPEFRAGLHGGTAVVTWVGETKKEIVYHGDVLNTAARIQVESKQGPYRCLVSGDLLDQISLPAHLGAHPVGRVELRGKEEALPLFGLERADSST